MNQRFLTSQIFVLEYSGINRECSSTWILVTARLFKMKKMGGVKGPHVDPEPQVEDGWTVQRKDDKRLPRKKATVSDRDERNMLGATSPRTRPICWWSSSFCSRSSLCSTEPEPVRKPKCSRLLHTSCSQTLYLQRLDYNKDVIDSDGEHQEGNDLDHDERERDAGVAEDAQRRGHGTQNDQDAGDAQRDFRVHLCRENAASWLSFWMTGRRSRDSFIMTKAWNYDGNVLCEQKL